MGQGSGEIPLDYLMLSRVPVEFRSHLKLDCASALFWLHPLAPAAARDGYLKWQRSEVRRNCFYAHRAIARSAQFILDHQLEWAIAAARDGNFLGRVAIPCLPWPEDPRTCQPSKFICGPSGSILSQRCVPRLAGGSAILRQMRSDCSRHGPSALRGSP